MATAADHTLYAQWSTLPNHTVTFNSNGGSGSMSSQTTNVPTALTLNTFTRVGYTFSSWNTLANGTGTNYADGATYDFSADITLYARWSTLPNHTVTFNANGGSGSMGSQTANLPTALTLNTFTRPGYIFVGWNTLANGTGINYANGAVYDFTADITLYARWNALPNHTVTFNANGGSGSMSSQTANLPTALNLNTFTRTGYFFNGWNTNADGISGTTYSDGATYDFSTDITLYARWSALPSPCYALALGHTGQGADPVATPANSSGCATGYFTAGASISLSGAAPATGWEIGNWTGTNNDTSTAGTNTITMPASTHSGNVNYIQSQYTLAITSVHGAVTRNPDKATYVYGDVVQLTAVPDAGWSFSTWSGDLTGSVNPGNLTIDGNKSVIATFTQVTHSLTVTKTGTGSGTVTSVPAGIDCGSVCDHTYAENTVVTLKAATVFHSVFSGWSGGGCSGTGSCIVTMDKAVSVTAIFTSVQCYFYPVMFVNSPLVEGLSH